MLNNEWLCKTLLALYTHTLMHVWPQPQDWKESLNTERRWFWLICSPNFSRQAKELKYTLRYLDFIWPAQLLMDYRWAFWSFIFKWADIVFNHYVRSYIYIYIYWSQNNFCSQNNFICRFLCLSARNALDPANTNDCVRAG